MSPLWRGSVTMKPKTIQKRPSPIHNNHIQSLAQSITPNLFRFSAAIKGISLFISQKGLTQASMTVEASIVLPLFLFFFLNLMTSIELIRLHGNLELALWETGNRMSVYGSILDDPNEKESWWKELEGVIWSYTYVKSQIIDYLGRDYLEQSPLTYGTDGLQFLESNVYENKDCFEVVVTYSVSPVYNILGFRQFRMANKYYGHLWNGYELPGTEEVFVFVTENGEVYHTDRNCTHLQLSVRLVTRQQVLAERNNLGNRYTACEKCGSGGMAEAVYITDEGERYHNERDCPGLKRTVAYIPLSQAENLPLCLRCAQADS